MASPGFAPLSTILALPPASSFGSSGAFLSFYLWLPAAWDANLVKLAIVLASVPVAFALTFALLSRFSGESEVRLARRTVVLAQLALLLLALRWTGQAYFDLLYFSRLAPPRNELAVQWPAFAVARPAVGFLLAALGMLLNTHHAFRWLLVALQPPLLALDLVNACSLQLQLDCLAAATCTQAVTGLDRAELVWLQWLQYGGAFLSAWSVLSACATLAIIGSVGPRFPVRLFDTTRSLDSITHKARNLVKEQRERSEQRLETAELQAEEAAAAAEASGSKDAVPIRRLAQSLKAHRDAARATHMHNAPHARKITKAVQFGSRTGTILGDLVKVFDDNFQTFATANVGNFFSFR